ncbi:MAG: 3'-5' exonuclease [Magnetococcales bacterium]|nr:3'-5' exonuclease [Magnetococcales bacterium]
MRARMADWRRRYQLRQAPEGPLRHFLSTPFPRDDLPWDAVEYLALDFETTGFDAARHEVLSIGFVPIREARVRLGEAVHLLVRPTRPIPPETAVIHRLTDDQMALEGLPLAEALGRLLQAMAGRVILAHFAPLERAFIHQASLQLYRVAPPLPMVDTMSLALHALTKKNHPPKEGELRLAALRERHGLPRYRAHNALSDAVATAELFLAQMAHRGGPGEAIPLGRIVEW